MRKYSYLVLLVLAAFALAACRQSAAPDNSALVITLDTPDDAPAVGQSELVITVHTDDGTPVNDATVEVRGDMTHAGMQPEFSTAEFVSDGTYRAPFEWSMSGDWVVTVTATLPDGRTTSQEFPLAISSS